MRLFARFFVFAAFFVTLAPFAHAQVPRPTCIIGASAGSVQVGQTVNLTWQSANATAGNLTTIGSVPLQGTRGVIPTPPKSTYVGTFTGPGGSGICSITITVNAATNGFDNNNSSGGGSSNESLQGTLNSGSPGGSSGGSSGPLIPCSGTDCQACHLAQLAQNIINWLVGFSIPLAAALFAYAGVMLFTSGGDPNGMKKAKDIGMSVGIGFVIVICAWLGVQTVLKTVLTEKYYSSWNQIQCVDNIARPRGKTINDLLSSLPGLNTSVPISIGGTSYNTTGNQNAGCIQGDQLKDGQCYSMTAPEGLPYDPLPQTQLQAASGDCSATALSDSWGSNAATMSCITQAESSCVVDRPSRSDIGADRMPFSSGLYQINFNANYMQCAGFNDGQKVDCPKAFSGRNYNGTVSNQDLYQQCLSMANNYNCATQNAQRIYQNQGPQAWSTYAKCR